MVEHLVEKVLGNELKHKEASHIEFGKSNYQKVGKYVQDYVKGLKKKGHW